MDQDPASPIRVLLVDHDQLLTDALAELLGRAADIEVVGVGRTVRDATSAAVEQVDVVLIDYSLPDGTGADATRVIKARSPSTRVILLTAITDDETVLDAIRAGADGYLTRDRASEEVVNAVRAAHAGEILLPRAVVYEIAERVALTRRRNLVKQPMEPLTPRELEVLAALVEGLSSVEICDRLLIAQNTLRTHVQNIMAKLRVHSKLEAVALALRHELVPLPRRELAL